MDILIVEDQRRIAEEITAFSAMRDNRRSNRIWCRQRCASVENAGTATVDCSSHGFACRSWMALELMRRCGVQHTRICHSSLLNSYDKFRTHLTPHRIIRAKPLL